MQNQITISSMKTGDIPGCVQIMTGNPLWQRYGVTMNGACEMFTSALEEGATILVARIDGQPIGFIWYVLRGAWDRSGYIRLIGVSPQYQGQKLGEQLMVEAEAHIADSVTDVFLLVTDSNTGAQRFYRRLGYEQVGAIPDYVVPGISEYIFFKKLPQRTSS